MAQVPHHRALAPGRMWCARASRRGRVGQDDSGCSQGRTTPSFALRCVWSAGWCHGGPATPNAKHVGQASATELCCTGHARVAQAARLILAPATSCCRPHATIRVLAWQIVSVVLRLLLQRLVTLWLIAPPVCTPRLMQSRFSAPGIVTSPGRAPLAASIILPSRFVTEIVIASLIMPVATAIRVSIITPLRRFLSPRGATRLVAAPTLVAIVAIVALAAHVAIVGLVGLAVGRPGPHAADGCVGAKVRLEAWAGHLGGDDQVAMIEGRPEAGWALARKHQKPHVVRGICIT